MIRTVGVAVALALLATAGMACEGQEVQFEDQFEDTLGGWDRSEERKVTDGRFTLTMQGYQGWTSLNRAFVFEEADTCVETIWANDEVPLSGAGVIIWAKDYDNFYLLELLSNGKYAVYRKVNASWVTLQDQTDLPNIKKEKGASNTVRVQAKGNRAGLFVNGEKVVEFRGQPPKQGWHVGVFAECMTQECKTTAISFDNVKITNVAN